jgi:hypothetical protein
MKVGDKVIPTVGFFAGAICVVTNITPDGDIELRGPWEYGGTRLYPGDVQPYEPMLPEGPVKAPWSTDGNEKP